MDRNIWVRIRATGADTVSREVRRASDEIKKLATVTRFTGRDMRTGTAMIGQSVSEIAPRTRKAIGDTIHSIQRIGPAVAAQARVIRQSVSQMAQSMGLLKSGNVAGPSGFRLGIEQMTMSVRIGAAAIRSSTGNITSSFKNMTSNLIANARRLRTGTSDSFLAIGYIAKATLGNAMSSVATKWSIAAIKMKAVTTSIANGLKTVASASTWASIKTKINELGESHKVASHTIGIAFGTIAASIGGGLAFATKQAVSFDRIMRNVQSISQEVGEEGIKVLSDQIINLSTQIPQTADQLATGLYEIAQAGLQGAEGFQVLDAAAKAASAGLTDTVTASRGLLAVLNAYGREAGDASYISDVLFQTVKVGIITFEELSQQIGDFVGFAAAAKIPLEDLGVAMAAMTRAGIPAAEASTSLNRVIQAFVKPSRAMQDEMGRIGITIDDLREGGLGLIGALEKIRKSTGGQITVLQKLFPEIRAARGAYAIMAANGELLNEVLGEFGDKATIAGLTARTLAIQSKSAAYQLQLTKNVFNALAINIGEKIIPYFIAFLQAMQDIGKSLNDLPGPVKTVIIVFGGLFGVLSSVAAVTFLLAPRIASVKTGLAALKAGATTTAFAMTTLKIAMSALSILTVAATLALGVWIASRVKANQAEREFKDLLRQTNAELNDVSREGLAQILSEDGTLQAVKKLGIETHNVVDAMLGSKNAAHALADEIKTELGGADAGILAIVGGSNRLDQALMGNTHAADGLVKSLRTAADAAQHGAAALAKGYGADPADISPTLSVDPKQARELADLIEKISVKANLQRLTFQALRREQEASATQMGVDKTKLFGYESGMSQLDDQVGKLTESQEQLNKVLGEVSSPGDAYKDAADALKPLVDLTQVYNDALQKAQDKADKQSKDSYKAYTDSLKAEKDAARDRARTAKDSITDATAAAKSRDNLSKQARAAIDAQSRSSKRAADDAAREALRASDQRKKTADDFKKDAKIGLNDYIGALQDAADEQDIEYQNMAKLTRDGFGALAREIMKGGDDAAPLLAMVANGSRSQIKKINGLYESLAPSAKKSWNEYLDVLREKQEAWESLNKNIFKLVARGRSDLIDAVLSSDLDPEAQANVINQAVHQSKKGLDEMTELITNANNRGSEEFAVFSETNITTLAEMVAQAEETGKKLTLKTMFKRFKELTDNTNLTKEQFVENLSLMGGAIEELPKNVQVQVNAFVEGTDKLQKLKADLEAVKNLGDTVPAQAQHALESALESEITPLEAKLTAKIGITKMDVTASNVYLNSKWSAPHGAAADGVINLHQFAMGGALPGSAIIQPARKQLIQWAEPSTGGEAFIPLSKSKRSRSTAILNKVAEIFDLKVTKRSNTDDSTTENVSTTSKSLKSSENGTLTSTSSKNYEKYENGVTRSYTSKDLKSYENGVVRLNTHKSLSRYENGVVRNYENGVVRTNTSKNLAAYENGVVRVTSIKNFVNRDDGAIHSNSTSRLTKTSRTNHYENGVINTSVNKSVTSYDDGVVRKSVNDTLKSYANGVIRTNTVSSVNDISRVTHYENGVVVDPVTMYARGGVLPRSAIVQPVTKGLVQWAEPGTGGEAFIPLAKDRRARSTQILKKVAKIFNLNVSEKPSHSNTVTTSNVNTSRTSNAGDTYNTTNATHATQSMKVAARTASSRVASQPVRTEMLTASRPGRMPYESGPRTVTRAAVGVAMGVAPRTHSQSRVDHSKCSRGPEQVTHTFEQPVYVDQVVAHDYDDFRGQLDSETRFRTMPGNLAGRRPRR